MQKKPHGIKSILKQAVEKKIISTEQAFSIGSLQSQQNALSHHLKLSFWIALASGLFISAGLLLIVSHNWQSISPSVRIVSFLTLLSATAMVSIYHHGNTIMFTLSSVFWIFLFILGIGLYAQTFHLSGDPIQSLYLWALAIFPIVLLRKNGYYSLGHSLLLYAVLFSVVLPKSSNPSFIVIDRLHVLSWIYICSAWAMVMYQNKKTLSQTFENAYFNALALWLFALPLAIASIDLGGIIMHMLLIYALGLGLYTAHVLFTKERSEQKYIGFFTLFSLVYYLSFHDQKLDLHCPNFLSTLYVLFFLTLSLFGLYLTLNKIKFASKTWKGIFIFFILTPLLFLCLLMPVPTSSMIFIVSILANLYLFFAALCLMFHGSFVGSLKQVNMGIGFLLLLLVTRFFDLMGSFIQSGLGFIFLGSALALLAYFLHKTRSKLLHSTRFQNKNTMDGA